MAAPGDPMQIIPRRGDYFLLDHAAGDYVRHTIFQLPGPTGKGVLVTPTVHGNLLVGPTSIDIEDKEATATTAAGLAEIPRQSRPRGQGPAPAPDHHQLCGPARPRTKARLLHRGGRPRLCGLRRHRVARPVQRAGHRRHGGRHRGRYPPPGKRPPLSTPPARASSTPRPCPLPSGPSSSAKTPPTGRSSAAARASPRARSSTPSTAPPAPAAWTGSSAAPGPAWAGARRASAAPASWRSSRGNWASPLSEVTKAGGRSKIIVGVNKDAL